MNYCKRLFLFFLMAALTFSCGNGQKTQKVGFTFNLGALTTSTGGTSNSKQVSNLYVKAIEFAPETQDILQTLKLDVLDLSVEIPYGLWKFYFVGMSQDTHSGTISPLCGSTPRTKLDSDAITLEVIFSQSNCQNPPFPKIMQERQSSQSPSQLICPSGFIVVPGSISLGTADFCVMKYEAKEVTDVSGNSTGNAISQAAGAPWINIKAEDAQSNCEKMTEATFNGTFTLISNPEWMTIARDIEAVGTNWSDGTTGQGNLARGWSAGSNDPFENTSAAPSTGADCLFNSGADTCAATGTHRLRRTHQLSNGANIWDFSGNVSEWVDWDGTKPGFSPGPKDGADKWQELTTLSGSVIANDISTSGGYSSTQQLGRWYGGTGSAAHRGGMWNYGANAGAFTLELNDGPTYMDSSLGFRCVYRP